MKLERMVASLLLVCCLCFFGVAWGEESRPEGGETLSNESTSEKESPAELDEMVVTATKYETSIKDVPSSMTVITGEELAAQNLPNGDIADALRSISGITLRRAYAPFPGYINIRGATSDGTVVLINGVPTNWEITQAIPPENVERVEIMRGPASALYGANATGGVVNIITKEGGEGIESNVGGGYGTFNTWRINGASDGTIDKFHYSLAAYKEASDGANIVKNNVSPGIHMIEDCSYAKWAASLTASYDLPEKGKLSFLYNFFHDDYTRGRPNVGGDWDRNFTTLMLDQPFGDMFFFKGYVGFRYDDLLHLYDKGGTNYQLNQKRDMIYSEVPVELELTTRLGYGNSLTAGFFANHQDTDQQYKKPSGLSIGDNKYKVRTLAGYLQDVWKPIDPLAVTLGLRFDHWENYDNQFYNFKTPNPADRTESSWSPKLGARYNFPDTTAIWANYATGYLPPTPEQLYDDRTSGGNPRQPNPDLEPETTRSWELGMERWFAKQFQAKVAGFYSYTDDKIISWFNASNIWINENIGRSKSYGVEVDFLYRLNQNWSFTANYTWNPATIDKNPAKPSQEGNDLPFSPRHKANIGVTYNLLDNIELSVFGRYMSEQQTNDDNVEYTKSGEQQSMPASFVVDFKGTKHIALNWGVLKQVDLSFSVDNLFNTEYRTFYIYEDPGTVFFGETKFYF